jgi:hypothetical protein
MASNTARMLVLKSEGVSFRTTPTGGRYFVALPKGNEIETYISPTFTTMKSVLDAAEAFVANRKRHTTDVLTANLHAEMLKGIGYQFEGPTLGGHYYFIGPDAQGSEDFYSYPDCIAAACKDHNERKSKAQRVELEKLGYSFHCIGPYNGNFLHYFVAPDKNNQPENFTSRVDCEHAALAHRLATEAKKSDESPMHKAPSNKVSIALISALPSSTSKEEKEKVMKSVELAVAHLNSLTSTASQMGIDYSLTLE